MTAPVPILIAGPILRNTTLDAVTVWVALSESSTVTLKVYHTDDQGQRIAQLAIEGQNQTVRLGARLHITAVTASRLQVPLHPGQIYAYDLQFCSQSTKKLLSLRSETILDLGSLSYFVHRLPTFTLPPTQLIDLKIVHGSCRKPHGGGPDILPVLDDLLTRDAQKANERPHQLFLTGDQIYGDDVADPFLWIALRLGPVLMGWEEVLPVKRLNDGTFVNSSPKSWLPGQRTEIARQMCGFTAMLPNHPNKAKSHLFSFTEYCIAYLLAWSPVLWPEPKQILKANPEHNRGSKQWSKDAADMQTFVHGTTQVRRALANIPTYMICDDHDITDDWYLNRTWCNQVLSKPLGRCVVQNGLLAYALFQAWGNTPEQFLEHQPGGKLLEAVEQWTQAGGSDKYWQQIGRYLGMPLNNDQTQQPQMQREKDILVLKRDPQALRWSYTIRSYCHEVLVLDTRTWRGYPEDDQNIAPPMLLCPSAFQKQIENPLEETDRLNQNGAKIQATLIVLPTNLISLSIIDRVQEWHWRQGKVFGNDVGDAWNLNHEALTKLLNTLSQHRDRILLLSGDIHYSGTVRIDHWEDSDPQNSQHSSLIIQLTSSAMKNAELATYLVNTRLKSLFPEPSESWLGQQTLIAWVSRQKVQLTQLPSTQRWSRRARQPRLCRFIKATVSWLWRNRWFQEGPEVVGHNNIGLVTWSELLSGEPQSMRHDIYWYPPWDMTRPVKSRYQVSLKRVSAQSVAKKLRVTGPTGPAR